MTCKTCQHPERAVIDAMIADKIPFLQIAAKFGLNQRSVNTHGKKHVEPFIEQVERQAQAAVLARVMKYRDEVNLPLPEKSKYVEDKLWNEYEQSPDPATRVAVIKAIREQQQEQAKLTGAYQQSRPPDEAIAGMVRAYAVIQKEFVAREGREPSSIECEAIITRVLDINGRRVDEKSFRKALAESEIETSSQMVN